MNYFSNFHQYWNLKTNGKCRYTRDLMCMSLITVVNKQQAKNCVGFNNLLSPTCFKPTSNIYEKYLAFNCKDQKCSFKASFIYRSRMNFTIPRFSHKGAFLKYFIRWQISKWSSTNDIEQGARGQKLVKNCLRIWVENE